MSPGFAKPSTSPWQLHEDRALVFSFPRAFFPGQPRVSALEAWGSLDLKHPLENGGCRKKGGGLLEHLLCAPSPCVVLDRACLLCINDRFVTWSSSTRGGNRSSDQAGTSPQSHTQGQLGPGYSSHCPFLLH